MYTTTKTLYYATLLSCWAQSPLLLRHKIVERNLVKVDNVCNGFYFIFPRCDQQLPAAVFMCWSENRAAESWLFQAR